MSTARRADLRGVGFKGFDGVQWYGIVGPAKMPREVTQGSTPRSERRSRRLRLSRLVAEAIEPMPMSPGSSDVHKAELDRYVALARERNIRLDE